MKDKVKACPGKELKQMSTGQLDVLLQTELKKELPDESIVMPILQELQEREKDYPVMVPDGLIEHMAGYKESLHTDAEKPNISRKRTLRIVAVAALVCVVLMAIPRTVGAESVFQVLYRWSGSFFEFFSPGKEDPLVEYEFKTDNDDLQQLYDMMVAEGVTDPVVPMWLPEGYELLEIKTMSYPDGNKVFAKFLNNGDGIVLSYRVRSDDVSARYEKGVSSKTVYEINGVSHYIMENNGSVSVVWTCSKVECLISANLNQEVVRKIIVSIYTEE